MRFKRLLIILISLGAILMINTSCENDRDYSEPENNLDISDLGNTYATNTLIINAHEAEVEQKAEVTINGDNTATFKLKNMVEGHPEVTFTTAVEKKEGGIYKFDQTEHIIEVDGGISYRFSGAFIGTEKEKVSLVVNFEEKAHTTVDDIIAYKQLNGSTGQFFQQTLFVNGLSTKSEFSTSSSQAVRFSKVASTGKIDVAIANPFFNVGTITIKDIQLVRSLEKPNLFTFIHYDEGEPGIVNDNTLRTVTITKGVYDNGVVYIEGTIVSKFEQVGAEWQIDPADKDNFAIILVSKNADDKLKDDEKIEFIKKHSNIFIPLLIRANSIKFNEDISTDITYLTNNEGVIKLEAQGGYRLFSQTFMNFGISESAMIEIVTRSNDKVTIDNISSLFPTVAGLYRYFPLTWGNTSSENIKTWILTSISQVRPFATLASITMPTTEADMTKMGYTMAQKDIDTLKEIFTYMGDSNKTSTLKVTVGIKKTN